MDEVIQNYIKGIVIVAVVVAVKEENSLIPLCCPICGPEMADVLQP